MSHRMRTTALFLCAAAIAMGLSAQRILAHLPLGAGGKSDDAQIHALLDDQTAAWNRGDVEAFMAGYLEIGRNGICRREWRFPRMAGVTGALPEELSGPKGDGPALIFKLGNSYRVPGRSLRNRAIQA